MKQSDHVTHMGQRRSA